jgi:serine-type D-Ala-D-Ala carboxypeptidase (penicillin-binding protein 5/6)
MRRRLIAILLLLLALCIAILTPVLAFTPTGQRVLQNSGLSPAPTAITSPTPIPTTPTPIPTPQPVLTARGKPPTLSASAGYLIDMDTGNTLVDTNGEKPLPMASTTKIMTALVALQTGDLNQLIPVGQDAYNRVHIDGGSSADLIVGDKLPLKEMLYALLLPSGDDAAVAIADALGNGSQTVFVQRMNLFAYRLRLFQTHYSNPDGLTLDDNGLHYTTAADLARLTEYALKIPLFAHIVKTQTYTLPANKQHGAYKWITTNNLLATYKGMIGVKTGHTDAAGYCLVFAATRQKHHLLGVILGSPSQQQRDQDVTTLLNWGFALPLLPPTF